MRIGEGSKDIDVIPTELIETPAHRAARLKAVKKQRRKLALMLIGAAAGVVFTVLIVPTPVVICIGAIFGGYCGLIIDQKNPME